MRARDLVVAMGFALTVAGGTMAGPALLNGPRPNEFPDVIVSCVGSRAGGGIDVYGTANDGTGLISSYAIASDSCNVGTNPAIWIDAPTGAWAPWGSQHPVIGGAIYRVFNGRIEQIGISWLKHGYCAADSCSTQQGQTGCTNFVPAVPGSGGCVTDYGNTPYPWTGYPAATGTQSSGCDWLGYGRATDTYGASLNGTQGNLGPRSEVNPWTGVFVYPPGKQGTNPVGCLNKRLLVRRSSLDSAQYPGAVYFGEVVYIQPDEWPGQRNNNYSYRKMTVGALGGTTGSNACSFSSTDPNTQSYQLTFAATDTTVPMKPAIEAWKALDPTVKLVSVDIPNDGRFYVASKVTNRGDGTWNYEYAVLNMNSDRGASSFMLPKSPSNAVEITLPSNTFKGVEYHSGEGYSLTPWTSTVSGNNVMWNTKTWGEAQNANAIRWSALFNFRMIANRPPTTGTVQLGMFKPKVAETDPAVIDVAGIDVPSVPACRADFDGNGLVSIDDIFIFLNAWFASDPRTEFDGHSGISVDDIFAYLNMWFPGCA